MVNSECGEFQRLWQRRVFGLGGDEDGNIRVGVFPECKEFPVGGAGFGGVAL